MRKIVKYNIEIKDFQKICIPNYEEFMTIQIQNNAIVMWVVVNAELNRKEIFEIDIYGTGQDISTDLHEDFKWYGGTVQLNYLVWHIWCKNYTTD